MEDLNTESEKRFDHGGGWGGGQPYDSVAAGKKTSESVRGSGGLGVYVYMCVYIPEVGPWGPGAAAPDLVITKIWSS